MRIIDSARRLARRLTRSDVRGPSIVPATQEALEVELLVAYEAVAATPDEEWRRIRALHVTPDHMRLTLIEGFGDVWALSNWLSMHAYAARLRGMDAEMVDAIDKAVALLEGVSAAVEHAAYMSLPTTER